MRYETVKSAHAEWCNTPKDVGALLCGILREYTYLDIIMRWLGDKYGSDCLLIHDTHNNNLMYIKYMITDGEGRCTLKEIYGTKEYIGNLTRGDI